MDKKKEAEGTEKIKLPQNLQREIIKFFLKTSIPKIAADKVNKEQQKPPNSKE